jgi:putative membrane protein
MRLVARILLNGLALVVAAYLLPGIHWSGGLVALVVAGCVVGLVNAVVKPIVSVLSCPLIVLTLGLFYLVINGLMLLLVDWLLDALAVDGLLWAIAGGLFLALWNLAIKLLFEPEPAPAPRAD